jgi:hypothetical protein
VTSDATETGMVGEAVDLAFPGADQTPLRPEQGESPTRPLLELARALQRQIGRLEPAHRYFATRKLPRMNGWIRQKNV